MVRGLIFLCILIARFLPSLFSASASTPSRSATYGTAFNWLYPAIREASRTRGEDRIINCEREASSK
jgi:hypothetical protein